MIALVTTYFLVAYILVPGIIFRSASSARVRLKIFQRTRTQEATFSVAVAIIPFGLALFGVWHLPLMRHYPFPVSEGTAAQRRQDYQRVTRLLLSPDASKVLDEPTAQSPTPQGPVSSGSLSSASTRPGDAVWDALDRVARRQARFLSWYLALTALEGWIFGYLASKYGDWQRMEGSGARASLRRRYNWMARKFILPNISEWHMLLTDFNVPAKDDLFVAADILQGDGNLYKGRVENHFLDPDGKLTGILLKDVYRFDRGEFEEAKKASSNRNSVRSDPYWKQIPSASFYIGSGSISNLNIRFAPREDKALLTLATALLKEEDIQADDISLTSDGRGSDSDSPPDVPDLYS